MSIGRQHPKIIENRADPKYTGRVNTLATNPQKNLLKKLGYDGDLDTLTVKQASVEITKLQSNGGGFSKTYNKKEEPKKEDYREKPEGHIVYRCYLGDDNPFLNKDAVPTRCIYDFDLD
jgi:hypothetical protein